MTDIPEAVDSDLSALTTDRQQEIKRSQAQLGVIDNLKAGFSLTALYAGSRKIEQEAPALFKPTITRAVNDLDIPLPLKTVVGAKALELDAGVASVKALFGATGEGVDFNYNRSEHVDDLIVNIPRKYHDDILSENSLEAAQRVRGRILEDLQVAEIASLQNDGASIRLAGSILDVDAPLAFLSGGSYAAAKTSFVGYRAAQIVGLGTKGQRRLAGLTQGVSGGAQAGLLVGGADAYLRETTDGLDVIYSTLGGAVIGGTFGGAFGTRNHELKANLTATLDDFEARVSTADETLTADYDADAMLVPQPLSVGAAQSPTSKLKKVADKVINDPLGRTSSRSREIIDAAHKSNIDADFYARREEDLGTFWEKIGNGSWSTAVGTGFASKMYRSDSAVMNWMGRVIFESPNGFNRGTATSAVLMENYNKRIQTQFQGYSTALKDWSKRNNHTFLNSGHGTTSTGKAAFNREVMLERNARQQGRKYSSDPDVIFAADNIDNAAREAWKIAKGKDGELSVDGFENVKENAHYTPYNWSGAKISNLIRNAEDSTAMRNAITKGLADGYRAAGMAEGKDADAVANAVIRRAQLKEAEIDTSVISLLQKDGQEFLRDALEDAGTSARDIDGIMKRLVGAQKDRSKEGFAKSKNEVDMEQSILLPDGKELKVVDLLSNDLYGDWQRYTRRVSGASALARHGITNRAQRKELIEAIHAEQRSIGEPITPAEEISAMLTNFDGGAVKGWANSLGGDPAEAGRLVATSKRLVQLAWMNKLGLTQLGETSAIMAQNGLQNWATRGPMAIFNKELKAGNQALLDDMAYVTGDIGRDHDFFGQHLNLDEVSVLDKADFQGKAQKHISDAVYIQGFTSMFNQVRAFQQKTAALGMADKVMRVLQQDLNVSLGKDGKLGKTDLARLEDFGVSPKMQIRIQDLIEDGTIEFNSTGKSTFVNKLNMSKWDADLAEEFGAAITRNINQVVQKSMAGESDAWMHTGWGAILTHLKTFPMQATQKQMVRHFRHNDPEAYAAVGYGLATAMAVSTVKEAIDLDKTRDMDLKDHAKRAFSYSNMTGFIPMVHDPLMTMMGLDDARFNQFSPHSEITPPVLSFANDAIRLPGALAKALAGKADYGDKQAIRTLPYSNAYLVGDMWNNTVSRNEE